jgi:ketosteroid isomerase-like protein
MTLEQLLEKEKIKELRISYCDYYDAIKLDELINLFTDDAVCDFGPDFGGEWIGKEAIKANFAIFLSLRDTPYTVLHAVTNPIIKFIDASTAHGRWYMHDLVTMEGTEHPPLFYGIYDDIYKKIDDEWKIYQTRIDFLWPKRQVGKPREL